MFFHKFAIRWHYIVLTLLCMSLSHIALAYGTINFFGQHAEHEKITRRAYQCNHDNSLSLCLEPKTLDQLTGKKYSFGAIGYPDNPINGLVFVDEAHCDNGDFFSDTTANYRQSITTANQRVSKCRSWMLEHFSLALKNAARLVDNEGKLVKHEITINKNCIRRKHKKSSSKCQILKYFGIVLHASQDFYSHSNWTDGLIAKPTIANPQGLNNHRYSVWLNQPLHSLTTSVASPEVEYPSGLITGCYSNVIEALGCKNSVKHMFMSKDYGSILLAGNDGTTLFGPGTTNRGKQNHNFENSVKVAIEDSQYKLDLLHHAILQSHPRYGERIFCAIIKDKPLQAC